MPSAIEMARLVEAALREGRLPARKADRLFGGRGGGATCAICGRPIPTSVMEYEPEFVGDGRQFHVHVDCYMAFEGRVRER